MLKIFNFFLTFSFVFGNPTVPLAAENADQLDSPWMALISIDNERCGGSLIMNKYIVTAAHCFKNINVDDEDDLKKRVKVRLAEWNTLTDPDCEDVDIGGDLCRSHVEIFPKEIYIHDDYDGKKKKLSKDIAIIKLSWPPKKSALIKNIALPKSSECKAKQVNQEWIMTGFGEVSPKVFTTMKKKITIKTITNEKCLEFAGIQNHFDKATHICAQGIRGETTCSGDSGSPAFSIDDSNKAVLRGIVSFGVSECGKTSAPSGFVKVACYTDWIKATIKEKKDSNESDEDSEEDNESE